MARSQNGGDLNARPEQGTLAYYTENATQYARATSVANLTDLYDQFLPLLPKAGYILDVGCGGGRDMSVFKRHGFDCLGIDPVPELVKISQEYSGCNAIVAKAENIRFDQKFDGVWACASLLHLPRNLFSIALINIRNALKTGGVLFLSMQQGIGEKFAPDGRYFARYSSDELGVLVRSAGFSELEQWSTVDGLSGRGDLVWLNVRAIKSAAGDL